MKIENMYGSTLTISGTRWEMIMVKNDATYVRAISWSDIPDQWKPFWQVICKSVFERNQVAVCRKIHVAAVNFHSWVGEQHFSAFDEFTLELYGMFDEWLMHRPKLGKSRQPINGATLSLAFRRNIFNGLVSAFEEALTLELPEVSISCLERVQEARLNRFRDANKQLDANRADRVLTDTELDRLYMLLVTQIQSAREILTSGPTMMPGVEWVTNTEKPNRADVQRRTHVQRTTDLLAVTAAWLSIEHGIRPEEITALRLEDIREDTSGEGKHSLFCHAPNKNERIVPITESTLNILHLYISWSSQPRAQLDSRALLVDWTDIRKGVDAKAEVITAPNLHQRLRNLVKAHSLQRDDGSPLKLSLKTLRATCGSHFASSTQNREVTRRFMGHEKALTTDTYYITLAQSQLSHNVYDALHRESLRLATYYKRPIDDLSLELPEAYDLLQQNPERDIDEGICTVPQTTSTLADSCVRASSCLDCPFLVPESRKRQAFVEERDLYIRRAAETTDSRIQQQRLRHAAMANAYVVLIDNVGPNSDSIKIEDNNKRPRKRSYKK